MTTTNDDLALRNLMATYVDAVIKRDASSWGATWAENAEWNLLGNLVTGRDNIVGLWQQIMSGFELAIMQPSISQFVVLGDTATGYWYLQEFTKDFEGNTATLYSRYNDTYVKIDGQWLYQSRQYEILHHQAD